MPPERRAFWASPTASLTYKERSHHEHDQCKQWIQGHADLAIDLVRIYLGLGLFFKAIYFMSHRDNLIRLLNDAGNLYVAQAMAAHYVIPAHLLGGLLLTAGLLTRIAALAQIPILLGAIFYVICPI